MKYSIVQRRNRPNGKAWDIYHSGVSETAIVEIVATVAGLSVFDWDGNEILFYPAKPEASA